MKHRFPCLLLQSTLARLVAVTCLLALATICAPRQVLAVQHDMAQAEALALKAGALFKAGVFGKAADLYLKAFALSNRPLMIYNAARALEQDSQWEEARALFLHYLRLDGVPEDARAEASRRVAAIEARAKVPSAETPVPTPAQPLAEAPRPVAVQPQDVADKPLLRDKPDPANSVATPGLTHGHAVENGGGFPTGKTVAASVLLVGALGCYLAARSDIADALAIDVATDADKRRYLDLTDKGQQWRGTAVGLATAGAVVAVWALVDGAQNPGKPAMRAAKSWQVLPNSRGAVVAWRW